MSGCSIVLYKHTHVLANFSNFLVINSSDWMMYFSPRKLLLSHNTTAALVVETIATCACYILCAPNCTAIAQLDGKDLCPPPSPPPPATQKSNNMSMLLILMLSILGAAFLCLCYFTIMKRYRSNLSTSRRVFLSIFSDANGEGFTDENHGPVLDHPIWYIQTVGLQDSVIDSIPVFKYKKGDGLVEGSDCSVCLSEFEDDESLRLLPKCSHAFHISCIDTWLRSHKNCPLCRAPIVWDESSLSVDPTPASEDAVAGDDEQVNDGNGEARISELRNEGQGIGSPLDGHGKVYGRTNGVRVLSDLGDHRTRTEEELQAVRRSFSMDLGSASRIYGHVVKIQPIHEEGSSSLEDHQEGLKKTNSGVNRSPRKSFSFGRSLQSVPIRTKRSFSSSSGKSSVSRSQEMV